MKFQKGYDPRRNLSGRGHPEAELKDKLTRLLNEPDDKDESRTRLQMIIRRLFDMAVAGDMRAAQLLVDRAYGRPRETVSIPAASYVAPLIVFDAPSELSK